MTIVPDFATHYYVRSRPPFLNLSELEGPELHSVIAALQVEQREGRSARMFGLPYVELRREAEGRLRSHLALRGGVATRTAPHYFVLGESTWFRGLSADMAEVRVPLASLPSQSTSVTFWDSFAAMGVGADYGVAPAPDEFLDRLFGLEDLPELIAAHGMPAGDGGYDDYHLKPMSHFVEIQLWVDDPVSSYLSG